MPAVVRLMWCYHGCWRLTPGALMCGTHRLLSFITESFITAQGGPRAGKFVWLPRLPAPVRPMAAAIRTGEAAAGKACMAALFVTLTTRIYFFAHIFLHLGDQSGHDPHRCNVQKTQVEFVVSRKGRCPNVPLALLHQPAAEPLLPCFSTEKWLRRQRTCLRPSAWRSRASACTIPYACTLFTNHSSGRITSMPDK